MDKTLGELWVQMPHLSTAEIGLRMNMTKNAVCGRAGRISLDPRPSPLKPSPNTPAMKQRVRELFALGLSGQQIAKNTGLRRQNVCQIKRYMEPIERAGETTLPPLPSLEDRPRQQGVMFPPTEAEIERVAALAMDGMGRRAIAAAVGVPESTARKIMATLKLPLRQSAPEPIRAPNRNLPPVKTTLPPLPFTIVGETPSTPISNARSCQWPLWLDHERPKFRPDGNPLVCGGMVSQGSYCCAHHRVAYRQTQRQEAA